MSDLLGFSKENTSHPVLNKLVIFDSPDIVSLDFSKTLWILDLNLLWLVIKISLVLLLSKDLPEVNI